MSNKIVNISGLERFLNNIKTYIGEILSDKQDIINDLSTIRSNSEKGATALSQLDNKVDKVSGKGLSTEDFTTALKEKLQGLSNYDDTTISNAVNTLRSDLDTLVSGNSTEAIESFNEIIAFLDGVKDIEDLSGIIASIEQQIANKYTKPTTGIPTNDLSNDVQTALNKANTALQTHQDISGKLDKTEASTTYATKGELNNGLNSKQDIIDDLATIRTNSINGNTALTQLDTKVTGDSNIKNIVKVTSLPSNPDPNTLYVIVE